MILQFTHQSSLFNIILRHPTLSHTSRYAIHYDPIPPNMILHYPTWSFNIQHDKTTHSTQKTSYSIPHHTLLNTRDLYGTNLTRRFLNKYIKIAKKFASYLQLQRSQKRILSMSTDPELGVERSISCKKEEIMYYDTLNGGTVNIFLISGKAMLNYNGYEWCYQSLMAFTDLLHRRPASVKSRTKSVTKHGGIWKYSGAYFKSPFCALVDRAYKGTENDAPECIHIPPYLVTLYELRLIFHIYIVQWAYRYGTQRTIGNIDHSNLSRGWLTMSHTQ